MLASFSILVTSRKNCLDWTRRRRTIRQRLCRYLFFFPPYVSHALLHNQLFIFITSKTQMHVPRVAGKQELSSDRYKRIHSCSVCLFYFFLFSFCFCFTLLLADMRQSRGELRRKEAIKIPMRSRRILALAEIYRWLARCYLSFILSAVRTKNNFAKESCRISSRPVVILSHTYRRKDSGALGEF